jgi:sulfonate transport system substrate-binding protein
VTKSNSFFIANRDFAKNHSSVLSDVIASIDEAARWAEANRASVAKSLADVTGVPLDIQALAADRASFLIGPVTDDIIETQQGVADRFHKLGLIPRAIVIRDAVWKPAQG